MLKKLLKYDFNAIFKYWWIGALTTFLLSFVGAGCGSVLESPKDLPESVNIFATIGLVLIVLCFIAFAIMTLLLVYIRFYKHLFSDEGYLTFTLPVKRNQLLSSKLISGSVAIFLSAIVTAINAAIIILISFKSEIFVKGWFETLKKCVDEFFEKQGTFNVIAGCIEVAIIAVLSIILITLFTYLCITVGAVISKKAKLATAVAIYYGTSSVMTVFMYIFYFFGIRGLENWLSDLTEKQAFALSPVMLLLVVFTLLMLCFVVYTLINWLIDRKLNLN